MSFSSNDTNDADAAASRTPNAPTTPTANIGSQNVEEETSPKSVSEKVLRSAMDRLSDSTTLPSELEISMLRNALTRAVKHGAAGILVKDARHLLSICAESLDSGKQNHSATKAASWAKFIARETEAWEKKHKHLRETAEGGRKESQLQKLMQYRNFYVSVVSYIYFTRIIVLIIGTALSYEVTWMKPFCEELAGVVFFAYTGSKFKPMDNNPYLRVDLGEDDDGGDDDDELHGGEFGLRDGAESDEELDDVDRDGVELPTRGKRTKMVGGEEEP